MPLRVPCVTPSAVSVGATYCLRPSAFTTLLSLLESIFPPVPLDDATLAPDAHGMRHRGACPRSAPLPGQVSSPQPTVLSGKRIRHVSPGGADLRLSLPGDGTGARAALLPDVIASTAPEGGL